MAVLNKGDKMSGEWTAWQGGERPVAPGTVGAVKFADGIVSEGDISGCYWDWRFNGEGGDIVAYRTGAQLSEQSERESGEAKRQHSHYHKDVSHLSSIDVYRVLDLFGVTDQAIGHAAKKLLCAGQRGHKDLAKDIQDTIDTLVRWQEMRKEDNVL